MLLYRKQIINYEKQILESPLLITKHSTFCLKYCVAKRSDSTREIHTDLPCLQNGESLDVSCVQHSIARPVLVRAHHNVIKGFPLARGSGKNKQATYKD